MTSLETIVQQWDAALRAYVTRRVSDVHAVDDVVQDAYLRMQRGLGGLRDEERVAPWLFRIARSAVTDHHRARARKSAPRAALTDDPPARDGPDTDEDLHTLVGTWLASFLQDLKPQDREALEAVDIGGESQADYARRLGLSLSTARSRVQRARARLRRLLEDCCRVVVDRHGGVLEVERGCDPCDDC